jgi:hypothetical protein
VVPPGVEESYRLHTSLLLPPALKVTIKKKLDRQERRGQEKGRRE